MYKINRGENRIAELQERTFSELGFREREHLQEWLANTPQALGEDLLVIQKEFSGFSDTNERLDLLALDKRGDVVVIENKLDDSGRDVMWQVLKYASYCSSLSKDQIKDIYQEHLDKHEKGADAEERLSEYFENTDYEEVILNQGSKQRIIMVAGSFRKEVTSTVLWLMNYKIRIQCFKVTPFSLDKQLFLNVEQILPVRDAEEFTISMAEKTQDDISSQEALKTRHKVRIAFWSEFLQESNKVNDLFRNISPSKDSWIGIGMGLTGVNLNLVVSKSYARSEIYISRGDQEENKRVFDLIAKTRDEIEQEFGESLIWERMDDKITCRIKHQEDGFDVYDKEDWNDMIAFLVDSSQRLDAVMRPAVKRASAALKRES